MSESIPAAVQPPAPAYGVDSSAISRDSFIARSATTGRLYMTSDLRAATGLTRTHLDYYLREGLILPTTRSESGYLLFDDAELDRLRAIIADRAAGVPLRVIRQRLGR
jgi:hypothetical protein